MERKVQIVFQKNIVKSKVLIDSILITFYEGDGATGVGYFNGQGTFAKQKFPDIINGTRRQCAAKRCAV